MGLDEYILALLAIISGLAVSEMIGGLHGLLFHRDRVKWDWLAPLAALHVAWSILASWWISWLSNHDRTDPVMFGYFLLLVAQLICLFIAGRGILPTTYPAANKPPLDLSRHYFSVKRYVWGAMAANILLLLLVGLLNALRGSEQAGGIALSVPTLAFAAVAYLALALVDNRWFHRIVLPLAFAILVSLTLTQTIAP